MVGESERTLLLYLLRAGFAECDAELCSGVLSFTEGGAGVLLRPRSRFFLGAHWKAAGRFSGGR